MTRRNKDRKMGQEGAGGAGGAGGSLRDKGGQLQVLRGKTRKTGDNKG